MTDRYAAKHCAECKECDDTFETDNMVATEKGLVCEDCVEEAEADTI